MQTTRRVSSRSWRSLSRPDRWAVALIVGLPLVIFSVPALFGHPAIAQDNLIQNFPLRVLVGQQIDSGHLPLFNRLADSGTPLLGGMNAGAFFPLTWLFAVLPAIMSWVLNMVAVYAAAGLGVFVLLRWHRLGTLASCTAALVYAWSGAMIGQMVHLGVVQGYAMLPWALWAMLLFASALRRTSDGSWRTRLRALAPSVLGLTALWGLADLTGEPRAIAEMQLLLIIVVPVVLVVRTTFQPVTWRDRVVYVAGVALAVVWGAIIGLGQLLPGLSFIDQSQRTDLTYQWFGAGSLYVKWTSLLFVPDLFGGNGLLHQPSYFVNYNLPEVTGYVGVLALVGFFAFLTRVTRRGWRGEDRQWVLYVALIVVGLFATWGSYTPLGHVFRDIPLFGSTRLQSRSVILVDLGLVVFLGWFVQRMVEGDFVGAGLRAWRKWVTLAPAIVIALLAFFMLFFGNDIVQWMTSTTTPIRLATYERPTLLLHLGLALAFLVALSWGVARKGLVRALCVLVALDVLIFALFASEGFLPGHVNVEPSRAYALSAIDPVGRYALVDPSGANHYTFEDLGAANMNVFTKLPSVQGYGSLIDELYGNVTQTHPLFGLDGCQLARGVYHQLQLSTVVVPMDKLTTLVQPRMVTPPQCVAPQRATSIVRYFGENLPVRSITVEGVKGAFASADPLTAQLLNAKDEPEGTAITMPARQQVNFDFAPQHEAASGVLVSSISGILAGSVALEEDVKPVVTYDLDTQFQQALSSSAWRNLATVGSLAYFRATSVRASAWLGTHAATSRIKKIVDSTWGDSWITVAATHPTVLKRSMEWIPGWHATAVNLSNGRVVTLHVVRSGLIQQVIVPPGTWKVHFHYHAPFIDVGLAGSIGGTLLLLAGCCVVRGWVPRRRKSRVNA
ncbi:MAG: hypothetical protein WAN30_05665 [Acidimicrobiales bacterium]